MVRRNADSTGLTWVTVSTVNAFALHSMFQINAWAVEPAGFGRKPS
jgi:hypothetical protein